MSNPFLKSTTALLLVFSSILLNAQTAQTTQTDQTIQTAQSKQTKQTDKAGQNVQTDTSTLARDVYASVFVASPGDVLYSRVGHCAIHMQAPDYNLDYVFSYEAEDVRHQVLRFLAGDLKMGMFAIPTQEYLNLYRNEDRGVVEYTLNLPTDVKRELWRVLDNHVMEGANLPYDYLNRGCAHSVLMMLIEALDTIPIVYGPWPEKFKTMTRRELTGLQLKDAPWTWAFLNLITDGSTDANCSKKAKIIMPADLVEVLQQAKVKGNRLLSEESTTVIESISADDKCWFTPLLLSLIILFLALACIWFKKLTKPVSYGLLAIQTLLGLLVVYLVFFSSLVCTEWSWLVIPFNPLPAIFWKWRKYWLLPYSIVLGIWSGFMLFWPHMLTDTCYIVLAIAIATSYAASSVRNSQQPTANSQKTTFAK